MLALAAIACFVVAILRRHAVSDLPQVEGAYFQRSTGSTAYSSAFLRGSMLSPFHPLHAYLWLGLGLGFAVSAFAVFVTARRATSA